jgi:hypothetical protein
MDGATPVSTNGGNALFKSLFGTDKMQLQILKPALCRQSIIFIANPETFLSSKAI